jgi:hypothetical protein
MILQKAARYAIGVFLVELEVELEESLAREEIDLFH